MARAIVEGAQERGLSLTRPEQFTAIPGHGIEAVIEGKRLLCGNHKLMEAKGIASEMAEQPRQRLSAKGNMLMYVAVDGKLAALLSARDKLKPSSVQAVSRLKDMGIEVVMLTGDNAATAQVIAKEAGIDHVIADVLPEHKAQEVAALKGEGHKVCMVSTGVNDAPALVSADVGMGHRRRHRCGGGVGFGGADERRPRRSADGHLPVEGDGEKHQNESVLGLWLQHGGNPGGGRAALSLRRAAYESYAGRRRHGAELGLGGEQRAAPEEVSAVLTACLRRGTVGAPDAQEPRPERGFPRRHRRRDIQAPAKAGWPPGCESHCRSTGKWAASGLARETQCALPACTGAHSLPWEGKIPSVSSASRTSGAARMRSQQSRRYAAIDGA